MRRLLLNCVLMAGFAILTATNAEGPRDKRDLSLIKKFINLAIFGSENKTTPAPILINNEGNVRIFRIPGIDNVLIKAIPKMPVAVAIPEKPQWQLVAVSDDFVERPQILFDTPTVCDDIQANENHLVIQQPTYWQHQSFLSIFHRPIPFPSILKPVNPVKVPVPVLPTKYSYKQIHGDGTVTTYTSNDNNNVFVTESDRPVPLPPFVTYRIQEVMKLGTHGMQGMATIPVFEGNIRNPMVQNTDSPKVNLYPPTSLSSNYFYKQIHKDGTATSYSSDLKSDIVVSQTGKVPNIPVFEGDIRNPMVQHTDSPKVNPYQPTSSSSNYFYKQIHKDGTATSYSSDLKSDIVVSQTGKVPTIPVFEGDIRNPMVQHTDSPKVNPYQPTSSSSNYFYKQIHKDGTATSYSSDLKSDIVVSQTGKVPTIPVFEGDIRNPMVQHTDSPKVNPYQPTSSSSNYFYKQIHKDGTATSYSSDLKSDIVVSQTSKVPTIPEFITDRIEKVAATAVTGKQPNIDVLSGPHVGEIHWYNNKRINNYPTVDVRGGVQVKVESKGQEEMNVVPKGIHSYKTIHNDGTVTDQLNEATASVFKKPASNADVKLITPAFTENRLETMAKTSGGSFSYKILHNDGSVTNYGVLGIHKGVNGENKKVPLEKKSHTFQASTPQLDREGSASSFTYKITHNDGSLSSYSSTGVVEEKGSTSEKYKKNKLPNENEETAQVIGSNRNRVIQHDLVKNPQIVNPSLGSFSYTAMHNNGSMTIYSQNGVSEINGQHKANVNQNKDLKSVSDKTVKVNNGEVGPNKQVNEQFVSQKSTSPVSGSFTYKTLHKDGSMTIFSQNGVKEEQIGLKHKDKNQQILNAINQGKGENIVSSGSFSYKTINSDGPGTNYSSDSKEFNKVSNDDAIPTTQGMNFKNKKLYTNPQILEKDESSFSGKTVQYEGSSIQSMESEPQQQKLESHRPVAIDNSKTKHDYPGLGTTDVIPPAPELPEISSDLLAATHASILVADASKVLFTKPLVSSYTYKQINHNQPSQFTVAVNIDEAASKENSKVSGQVAASSSQTNKGDIDDKDYVYVPPANTNEPPPIRPHVPVEEIHKRTDNPPAAIVLTPVEDVTCVEKLSEHPIVVFDEPMQYSYEHRKVDSSAMIVKSDQTVVSVTISPKEDYVKRGDIP